MSQPATSVAEVVKTLASSKAEALSIKSQAMTPLSAPLAVGAFLVCVGVFGSSAPAVYFGFLIITVFSGILAWAYVHLLRHSPDRLGTEAYVIRREMLKIAAKDPELVSKLKPDVPLLADPASSTHEAKKRRALEASTAEKGGS